MPRKKKEGKFLNIKLCADVYDRLESYSEELGQTKTIAVERILREHFDRYDSIKQQENESIE